MSDWNWPDWTPDWPRPPSPDVADWDFCCPHFQIKYPNHQQTEPELKLLKSAENGDLDTTRELVVNNAQVSVNCENEYGATPLILAVRNSHVQVTRFLLNHDANTNAANLDGETVLGCAVDSGNVALSELLLEYGAAIDRPSRYFPRKNYSPLGRAIHNSNAEMVALLLRFGANTEETCFGDKTYTALFAASWKRNVEIAQLLLDHDGGASINTYNSGGNSPLCMACQGNNMELVQLLIQNGAQVIYDGVYPSPDPLLWAVKNGSLDLLSFLLDQTKNLQLERGNDNHPLSPALQYAVKSPYMSKYLKAAQLLVDHGADINDRAFCFLHSYARDYYLKSVRFLLHAGAYVNLADRESGETPLFAAANSGQAEIVKEFLKARADVRIRDDKNGETPLGVAYRNGHLGVVYLLLRTSPHVWSKLENVL